MRILAIFAITIALCVAPSASRSDSIPERRLEAPAPVPAPGRAPPLPGARPDSIPASPKPTRDRLPGPDIEGTYRYTVGGGAFETRVQRLRGNMFYLTSTEGWEGVGLLDGAIYRGVFHRKTREGEARPVVGDHAIDWSAPEVPIVRMVLDGAGPEERQTWHRVVRGPTARGADPASPKVVVTPPSPGGLPAFGDEVQVDELPEAITKPAPIYPDSARQAGIQGTVMVQALVLVDGTVGDARVVKSVPGLDEAAIACVRQWRFKPARAKGAAVATWVAVPVQFASH